MKNTYTYRHCAWPGCEALVKGHRLLCFYHWMSLPVEVRANIRYLMTSFHWDSACVVLQDYFTQERHVA